MRFEDLIAWQKAKDLAKMIYIATGQSELSRDFGLRDQLRRASVSAMSNIAEGFERNSSADFRRFLIIAKASTGEIRSQLILASEIGYLKRDEAIKLIAHAEELSKIISGLAKSLAVTKK